MEVACAKGYHPALQSAPAPATAKSAPAAPSTPAANKVPEPIPHSAATALTTSTSNLQPPLHPFSDLWPSPPSHPASLEFPQTHHNPCPLLAPILANSNASPANSNASSIDPIISSSFSKPLGPSNISPNPGTHH
ncbi:hypothetical protein E4T56_gene11093 [Termitomyces sp. T112]|nr:hypothetical protein E4T56_gene11093 [Termitomyces sp. T112]